MNFIARFFHQTSRSADVAKDRLDLILASDRSKLSPHTLDVMRDEIVTVLSKHVTIDDKNVNVTVMRTPEGNHIVANIPLMEKRGLSAKSASRRRSRQY